MNGNAPGEDTTQRDYEYDEVQPLYLYRDEGSDVQVNVPSSRCFTYPQGDFSVLPQILTLIATACALLVVAPLGNWRANFLCVQLWIANGDDTLETVCTPLALNDVSYWNNNNDQNWATLLQLGALAGILATLLGTVTFGMLVTASCFYLSPNRVLTCTVWLVCAAVLSALTLTASWASFCGTTTTGSSSANCSVAHVRWSTGAGSALVASAVYAAAAVECYKYYLAARRHAVSPSLQQAHNQTAAANSPTLNDMAVTVTRTILPDGTAVVESEYVDETGQLVSEQRTEEDDGLLAPGRRISAMAPGRPKRFPRGRRVSTTYNYSNRSLMSSASGRQMRRSRNNGPLPNVAERSQEELSAEMDVYSSEFSPKTSRGAFT